MWIFTTNGFISAVQHRDEPDVLVVRARDEESLRSLAELSNATITHMTQSDYAWRVYVTRREFEQWTSAQIDAVDYDNFKTAAAGVRGATSPFVKALHKVWSAMFQIQLDEEMAQREADRHTRRRHRGKGKGKGRQRGVARGHTFDLFDDDDEPTLEELREIERRWADVD